MRCGQQLLLPRRIWPLLPALRRGLSDAAAPPAPRRRLPAAALALGAGGGAYYLYSATAEEVSLAPGEEVEDVDAIIIGAGIMGASVALMMKLLHPCWKVKIVEQLDRVGHESSDEWNNAGTGHAALCEPNYTPWDATGKDVDITKAVATNKKFLVSLQWWTWLVEKSILPDGSFIQPAAHITFVHGEKDIEWLKKRVAKLKQLPTFAAMEYSEDYDQIQKWSPVLCSGRPREGGEKIAVARHPDGTEANYGLLTRNLVQAFSELGGEVQLLSTVTALRQQEDKRWLIGITKNDLTGGTTKVRAQYVFAGAGGGSLRILQKAGLPEVKGYGAMPVSGKFLVCQNPSVVEQHKNKVYGRAAIGAPPMSVPHLDWRTIYGRDCIFFGPFAGFLPYCFKTTGGVMDWVSTFNPFNLIPFIAMGLQNLDLAKYLFTELAFSTRASQLATLQEFVPDAKPEDWTMVWAGQRVQVVKPDAKKLGILQFGTEVVASKDKTIVGLLGASPGASVSPHIAIEVMDNFVCSPCHEQERHVALAQMIPTYGRDVNAEKGLYDKVLARAKDVLLYGESSGHRSSKAIISRAFDKLDRDRDGTVSPEEMKRFLAGQGVDKKVIERLISKMDKDNSGDISRDEFTAGFSDFVAGQVSDGEPSCGCK